MPDVDWGCPPAAPELRDYLLSTAAWSSTAIRVKHNRKRSVWRVPAAPGRESGLYLKCNHVRSWRDRLKQLWRCKAREEYEAGCELAAAGVPVVPMLAWGRAGRQTYLVTGELAGAAALHEVWEDCRADQRRRLFLLGLAAFLRQLAAAGLVHPDLHVGNILAVVRPDGITFHLVDVYGVRLQPGVGRTAFERTFAWLAGFARHLSKAEAEPLFAALLPATGAGPEARRSARQLRVRLELAQARAVRCRWTGRRRRLTRAGSLCEKHADAQGSWLLLRPFPSALAPRILAEHRRLAAVAQLIKNDRKRQLSRVRLDGVSHIVKEYRQPRRRGRRDSDLQSWLNTYRLALHSLPVAACQAWYRAACGPGFLVQVDAGSRTLFQALETAAARERRQWLVAAAAILAWLHRDGIAHNDLKTSNFILADDRPGAALPLRLIDADAVRFRRRVSARLRLKNLCQVLNLLPAAVTRPERLRFVAAYRRASGWNRANLLTATGLNRPPRTV